MGTPAMMKREFVERKEIELIHMNVANSNQDKLASIPTGAICLAFLCSIVWTGWTPSLTGQLASYAGLQTLSFACVVGRYRNLPPLPQSPPTAETLAGPAGAQPLLESQRSITSDQEWQEEHDREAALANSFNGAAAQ